MGGRQLRADDRASASQFRNDDDGGLLQHEAAGFFQPDGSDALLVPKIRLIA